MQTRTMLDSVVCPLCGDLFIPDKSNQVYDTAECRAIAHKYRIGVRYNAKFFEAVGCLIQIQTDLTYTARLPVSHILVEPEFHSHTARLNYRRLRTREFNYMAAIQDMFCQVYPTIGDSLIQAIHLANAYGGVQKSDYVLQEMLDLSGVSTGLKICPKCQLPFSNLTEFWDGCEPKYPTVCGDCCYSSIPF